MLGLVIGLAAYAVWEYPTGSLRAVGRDEYREIFGAGQYTKWQSNVGRAQMLQVVFASQMASMADTATMWHEARVLGPFAESLAARTGDSIIELDHRRYPLTRMVPLRIDVWTYYHRNRDGGWRLSTSLWY